MNRQGRILVVDDLKKWREQLVETLQYGGFYADAASTTAEVLQKLDEALYHMLLLDIRLIDADPGNKEGMDLLGELDRRHLSEAVKVIILSAYGTKQEMRVAFRDHKVADFLSKDEFNNRTFLDSVRQVFFKEININLTLDVHWQQVSKPEQIVLNLNIEGTRIKPNTPLQSRMTYELDDLLCRLFNQAQSILVRPLVPSQSGTGVLWVQPFYANGGGRAVIVKFGAVDKVEKEYHNFKEFIQPFIGGGRNTTVLDLRHTPHLGGIMYSLLGATNDQLEDFGGFYHRTDTYQIKEALNRLFLDTCGAWYANPGRLQPHNLTADYKETFDFTWEKLEHALSERLKSVQGKQQLSFTSLKNTERTFTNPLLVSAERYLMRSTYICTTHGDFNQHNLLVDENGHMWLIDFFRTRPGHILRDVAQLDSAIRFSLLRPDDATLDERLEMEEALCSIERFSQVQQLATRFSTKNTALAKAYAVVVHLRALAYKLVAQNPSDDISEYYIALFYNAINTIRFYSVAVRQREHALLCASLLADRLGLKG